MKYQQIYLKTLSETFTIRKMSIEIMQIYNNNDFYSASFIKFTVEN